VLESRSAAKQCQHIRPRRQRDRVRSWQRIRLHDGRAQGADAGGVGAGAIAGIRVYGIDGAVDGEGRAGGRGGVREGEGERERDEGGEPEGDRASHGGWTIASIEEAVNGMSGCLFLRVETRS